MDKKYIVLIAIVVILAILLGAFFIIRNSNKTKSSDQAKGRNEISEEISNEESNKVATEENDQENANVYSTGKHKAKIEIEKYGTIELELDADVAPISVANFAKLANDGFYNGLTFHRIIDGFMIQGGDPNGDGTGGSEKEIKGEFSANGVKNPISHVRGTISMARSSSFDSASSQFFIVHKDSTFLDGQYAGFGKVTSGIEIVDKICENTKVEDDNGTVLKENQPIITKVEMID